MKTSKRPWYSWLLLVIVVVAVSFVIYQNISEIRKFDFVYQWQYIVLAFFSVILAYIVQFGIWLSISEEYKLKAPILRASKAYFLSILGKYVPGKIGIFLVRVDAYRDFSRKQVAIATGFEMITSMAAACILVLIGVFSASSLLPPYSIWLACIVFLSILIFLYPPLFLKLINLLFRIIKRAPLEKTPSYYVTMKIIIAFTLVGLLHGLGLYFTFLSLTNIPVSFYLTITGVYYAAGLIGLFAFFAPGGIGVREGIMLIVLPQFIAEPVVILGAILIRLIMILVELFLAGISVIIEKVHSRKD